MGPVGAGGMLVCHHVVGVARAAGSVRLSLPAFRSYSLVGGEEGEAIETGVYVHPRIT